VGDRVALLEVLLGVLLGEALAAEPIGMTIVRAMGMGILRDIRRDATTIRMIAGLD
jgi:hypothetical protein